MRVLTTEQLSTRRELTPEGFLLCRDVPIMRTGELQYGPTELLGITPGKDYIVHVTRDEDTLFDPLTMASFQGKPITFRHVPGHLVTPKMAKAVTVGHMMDPRRGTGSDSDAIMVDFLFTDHDTIQSLTDPRNPPDVRNPQVSPSYTAVYLQDSDQPGQARQTRIVGNSAAIVPRGRGGPTCAIGDEETIPMSRFEKLKNLAMSAIRTGDAAPLTAAIDEAEREETASRVTVVTAPTGDAAQQQLLQAIESIGVRIGKLEEIETNRVAKATADAAAAETARTTVATADAARTARYPLTRQTEIASHAEVLAPGVKLPQPTGDAAADMLGLQRLALASAMTGDLKDVIAPMTVGIDLATADAAIIDPLFATAAAVRGKINNAVPTTRSVTTQAADHRTATATYLDNIATAWKQA